MDPLYINKERIASLLPMGECISVMENMFRSIAKGECMQPLRSLMWIPDKSGLLGMMPAYAGGLGVMGIKVISVFHGNAEADYPSHQGVVILFGAKHGEPLMIFDAAEITAIRTAAASALATRLLARENSELLAVIGSGEQAERHIEAILLVREIKQINLWGRSGKKASELANKIMHKYKIPVHLNLNVQEAVKEADIICTVTSSREPVIQGDWIPKGAHINAVGSSTPSARELDTSAILRSKLFADCYESIYNEAGDFLIPKREGAVTNEYVKGELSEVLSGTKKGRENKEDITIFKSLGIAAEDLFSAWHIYGKIVDLSLFPNGEYLY
jgi:alanine dehydrogenase